MFPNAVIWGLDLAFSEVVIPSFAVKIHGLRSTSCFSPPPLFFSALTLVVFGILKPPHPVKVSVNSNTTVIRQNWLDATCSRHRNVVRAFVSFILNGGAGVASCPNLLTFFCLQCSRTARSRSLRVEKAQRSARRDLANSWRYQSEGSRGRDCTLLTFSLLLSPRYTSAFCEIVVSDLAVYLQGSSQQWIFQIWHAQIAFFKLVFMYVTFLIASNSFPNVRFFQMRKSETKHWTDV